MKTLNFGEAFQLDPTLLAYCYHLHYLFIIIIIIIIILVNNKDKYLISYNVVIVYCSLFQGMNLVIHKPTEKMLPIRLFLCLAALTVHGKNYKIPSTLHKKYFLLHDKI